MVAQWLKAGVVEQGRLHRTEDGVPQGGVVSPVLLNIALDGMEQAAGVRYLSSGSIRVDSPAVIRYADDFARHEAPCDRMEVKGLHRRRVAARR
jgi:RNA-directed DNA polymerase